MLYLLGYHFISAELIRLHFANGVYSTIRLNSNSGKVFWRYKVNSISKIKHPGIYLGQCIETGNDCVIHNHIKKGHAYVDTLNGFSLGRRVFVAGGCTNRPNQVLHKALRSVLKREAYHPINFNCQTFVNEVCHNRRKSADAEKWKAIGTGL